MPSPAPIPTSPYIVSVFGSSRCLEHSEPYEVARSLGAALATAGFAVASGGYGGIMEAVSRGAAEAGGTVIGVVARALSRKTNRWVQQEIVVEKWEQRLFQLITLGDGYVACPGETGTLVELAVAWEMMSKGLIARKPLVALGEYWRPVVELIGRGAAGGPAGFDTEGMVSIAESVPAAVKTFKEALLAKASPRP